MRNRVARVLAIVGVLSLTLLLHACAFPMIPLPTQVAGSSPTPSAGPSSTSPSPRPASTGVPPSTGTVSAMTLTYDGQALAPEDTLQLTFELRTSGAYTLTWTGGSDMASESVIGTGRTHAIADAYQLLLKDDVFAPSSGDNTPSPSGTPSPGTSGPDGTPSSDTPSFAPADDATSASTRSPTASSLDAAPSDGSSCADGKAASVTLTVDAATYSSSTTGCSGWDGSVAVDAIIAAITPPEMASIKQRAVDAHPEAKAAWDSVVPDSKLS